MDVFLAQFFGWLIATIITLGIIAGFEIATVGVGLGLTVAAIWAVLIWGGVLILSDGDIF